MPVRPVMWIEFDAEASQQSRNVPSYTELKQGKDGTEVLKMKERLQALGYFSRGANISDKYNVTTTERVKLFQKVNGLKQTGVADEDTLMLLFSDAAKENPN
jgi:peptidoglycan hydrolase-like protein with peptidoglycan-binding domain